VGPREIVGTLEFAACRKDTAAEIALRRHADLRGGPHTLERYEELHRQFQDWRDVRMGSA